MEVFHNTTRTLLVGLLFIAPACDGAGGAAVPADGAASTLPKAAADIYIASHDQGVQADLHLQPDLSVDTADAAVNPSDGSPDVVVCTPGQTEACYEGKAGTKDVGACTSGKRTCDSSGAWGPCEKQVLPATEVCNNDIDEDCDGADKKCCFEKDFGKLVFDDDCETKKLTCPAGFHRTGQRYTWTGEDCTWNKHNTWAELECCADSDTTHDADHTYITCCPD